LIVALKALERNQKRNKVLNAKENAKKEKGIAKKKPCSEVKGESCREQTGWGAPERRD